MKKKFEVYFSTGNKGVDLQAELAMSIWINYKRSLSE
jgi:hypothetical protein